MELPKKQKKKVRKEGLDPPAFRFEAERSIQDELHPQLATLDSTKIFQNLLT